MSSFGKNIIPRREHRERAQPASRIQKHGLLEKKKDYKLRAKDRNRKRLRVKLLREKAAFRNPDEFYYGMIRSATDGGRVRRVLNEKEKDVIPIANRDRDQKLLAETQDARYVRVKYDLEQGRVEKMRKRLHSLDMADKTPRKHVVFVDDEDELEEFDRKAGGIEEHVEISSCSNEQTYPPEGKLKKWVAKEQAKSYKELDKRLERQGKLKTVLEDMSVQKTLLSKGRRFKVRSADPETGAPAIFRWRQERRR